MEAAMLKKAILLCAMLFLAGSSPSYAQRQAAPGTGDVQVRIVRVGFIVGGGGGEGNLTYRGKVYPFSVSGISVGTIGAISPDLVGRAYNLRSPSDIAGTYTRLVAAWSSPEESDWYGFEIRTESHWNCEGYRSVLKPRSI